MDQTQSAPADPTRVYTAAILLALFSFLTTLLILSPLCWHFRNGNIGATSLVAWIAILLLTTFLNALIWPHDNIPHWFSGAGLCDVEVKIQAGAQVALPASFAAVLRGLAAVLDTDHATLMQTKAQRRRNVVLDFSFCMGAPVLQMGVHEIVHYRRYAVLGIAGCSPILSESWLTFVLYFVPPMIWTVVDVVYAALILHRLLRYRLTFTTILASAQTTKSRFLRLYSICILWTLAFTPLMCWLLAYESRQAARPFSWRETHDHAAYHEIFMVPSNGEVYWDRWIWLPTGFCVFLFLGCGREAVGMYRDALLAVGLGRVVPALRRGTEGETRPTVSTIGSMSSKAKMLFKRKSPASDTTSTAAISTASTTRSANNAEDDPISPRTTTSLEAIGQVDVEQALPPTQQAQPHNSTSFFNGLTALFSTPRRQQQRNPNLTPSPLPLTELLGQSATMRATVSAGQRPVSLVRHVRHVGSDVLVRKEVRQGSEHEGV